MRIDSPTLSAEGGPASARRPRAGDGGTAPSEAEVHEPLKDGPHGFGALPTLQGLQGPNETTNPIYCRSVLSQPLGRLIW